MTPKEVQGLQSLAMAHGGSLTINPETGLPEAGFLSAILPMVAGFFLGPAGIGLTAMQSALAVGALGTAATGSLGKGFMMGLGAYGGAGLGAGLTNAGASTLSNVPGEFGVNAGVGSGADYAKWMASDAGKAAAAQTGTTAATTAAEVASPVTNSLNSYAGYGTPGPFSTPNVTAYGTAPTAVVPPAPTAPLTNASDVFREGLASPSDFVRPTQGVGLQDKIMSGGIEKSGTFTAPESQALTYDQATPTWDASKPATAPSNWDKASAGFNKATGSWEGAKEVWNATPTGTGYGLAATGMGVMQAQQEEAAAEAKAKADAMAAERRGYYRPYDFTTNLADNAFAPRESSSEFKYYDEPRFVARPIEKIAKEGGLMSLAVGGKVEEMSAANAIGANTGYPMANLQTPMYSNPMMSRAMPTNVISPSGDVGVNSYTGEQRMASGGSTDTKYSYDPETMKYTQATTSTPAANNLMGNPLVSGMLGLAPYMRTMGGGYVGGIPGATFGARASALFADPGKYIFGQQPAVTTETLGGMAAPYMPPSGLAAADTSMVPNIQLQPQQNVDQQLGLQAFYPMMEQQLAMKGSNLQAQGYAEGGTANGGYSLGSYSDGGRLLRGPGDGVSDSIPASIGDHQPARLADGEFVVPARIVSEIGNGSTEAGARKLYAMMDRVQKARKKTVGKSKVAVNTKADKLLPA
jgi:hypothetical protein